MLAYLVSQSWATCRPSVVRTPSREDRSPVLDTRGIDGDSPAEHVTTTYSTSSSTVVDTGDNVVDREQTLDDCTCRWPDSHG